MLVPRKAGSWFLTLLHWAERGWRRTGGLLDTISDSVLRLALSQPGLQEVFREGAVSLWHLMPTSVGCTARPVLAMMSGK